jgi:hypothetical protein
LQMPMASMFWWLKQCIEEDPNLPRAIVHSTTRTLHRKIPRCCGAGAVGGPEPFNRIVLPHQLVVQTFMSCRSNKP